MAKEIKEYLAQLKKALVGADPATVQDALSDAEEHLTTALDQALENRPGVNSGSTLEKIISDYGTPEEIAAAYKELEVKMKPVLAPVESGNEQKRPAASRFFGIIKDIRAYAALLYMLFSLVTGIFYFTWAVTGLSLSIGLIVLIIGLPFLVLYLLSVRGIALVEGRLIEAVLGVRMPRRPVFFQKNLGWWGGIKALFADRTTWTAILYMVLLLPLGITYFTLAITLVIVSLALIAHPVLQYGFDLPLMVLDNVYFYTPVWLVPFVVIAGALLFILTMHLARNIGRFQGWFAKTMLVRKTESH